MRVFLTAATALSLAGLHAEVPAGWHLAGSQPKAYEIEIDTAQRQAGTASGTLKSIAAVEPNQFGTMMQSIRADEYRGKNVKVTAYVKSAAENGAWLWFRVDEKSGSRLDNMHDRKVKGGTDWQRCELVLPVSAAAVGLAFGVGVSGTGQAWVDDVRIEITGAEVPRTGNIPEMHLTGEKLEQYQAFLAGYYPGRPAAGVNLDFESHVK